jgi:hypothetical protein
VAFLSANVRIHLSISAATIALAMRNLRVSLQSRQPRAASFEPTPESGRPTGNLATSVPGDRFQQALHCPVARILAGPQPPVHEIRDKGHGLSGRFSLEIVQPSRSQWHT